MGKGIVFVVFLIGFVIFMLIKLVATGTKAAYEAVFDPGAKDEHIRSLIAECMLRVSHVMHEKYTGKEAELGLAIAQLTPAVQSMVMDKGYRITSTIARQIVCDAIVAGGHASREAVNRA
jgi:hypothetical protein